MESPASASPASAAPIPWRRIVLWFLGTRLAIWAIAGLSLRLTPKGPFFYEPGRPLDWLMNWDGRWFLEVVRNGYSFDPTQMSSVNFLPAYPMSVRAMAWVVRDVDLAAYLVSHLYCFGAAVLLWRLVREVAGRDRAADGAVAFFLLTPVSVFYAAIYSEATFVFFALASMLAALRGRWVLAGLCGALAAVSRSVGLLLVIPLAIEFLRQHGSVATWRRPRTWLQFAACALPALGTAAYVAFLWWRFDNPRAYVISQQHGGHLTIMPWQFFSHGNFRQLDPFYKAWFGGAAASGIVLTLAGAWLRIPLAFTGFAVAIVWLYLSTSLEAMPRFMSVVFPFYCTLGIVRDRWPLVGWSLLGACAFLSVVAVVFFVNGYWFT